MNEIKTEKIQKLLAQTGIGSRRQIEKWILAGRVKVEGRIAALGERITIHAKIQVDGKEIPLVASAKQSTRVLLYNKPEGEICTRSDPENRPTVFSSLPLLKQGRWLSIGRLDINSSGLLLFTNQGELANQLMHPRMEIEREYAVRVFGNVTDEILQKLTQGVVLEDGKAQFKQILGGGGERSNRWYYVIVTSGRNRLVRRLWEAEGLEVNRLIRVRFGSIVLPRALPQGKWVELSTGEMKKLMR